MLRLTERQRLTYLDRGGARWVKRLLDEQLESTHQIAPGAAIGTLGATTPRGARPGAL